MKNTAIAKIFQDIADLLELKGENVFKIRAYQRAARAIEHLPREVEVILREGGSLRDITGVGEAIEKKTTELVNTGKLQYYEELRAEFPPGITTLLEVPGVGPKTAMRLTTELGVNTIEDLEKALLDGRVAGLSRMGEKTAENIKHALAALRRKDQRIPIGEALPLVEQIQSVLSTVPGVKNIIAAGSLRRFRETVGDIDMMGTADDPEKVIQAFVRLPMVGQVLAQGTTKATVLVAGGLQVDLRLVEHHNFGSLLQYFTGSKQHNIALRTRAQRQGLSLSEYGITDVRSGQIETFATEEDYYKRLGLQYIPPELREDTGEIEKAEKGQIPSLVELSDIKGDFHAHTEWSDGNSSIEDMAVAAKARGYEYLAITDHSAGRGIAHGLSVERLKQQIAEVRVVEQKVGIRLFTGMEVDIRSDGTLDAPEEMLAQVDIVVAAVHSAMSQDQDKMTQRMIKAMESPHVDILAHPTCRLLSEREPVSVDIEAIYRASLNNYTALEINAMPSRLDLKDIHAYRARELGVKLVIGTDSHRPEHLGYMRFGVGVARRAWCRAEDILNTWTLAEVEAFLRRGK
ncbi:MAG: DNA polymerase IV [Dehalococcoidia bacterium]|nr:DNA polymerase IV [Dehalococcoidia bacterium]